MATTALQLMAGGGAAHGAPRVILPVMSGLIYAGLFDGGDLAYARLNRAPGGGRCAPAFDLLPGIDGKWATFIGGSQGFDTGVTEPNGGASIYAVVKTAALQVGNDRPTFASASASDGKGLILFSGTDTSSASTLGLAVTASGTPSQPAAVAAMARGALSTPKLISGLVGGGALLASNVTDNATSGAVTYTGSMISSGRNILLGTSAAGVPLTGEVHMLLCVIYNRLLAQDESLAVTRWCRAYAAAAGIAV